VSVSVSVSASASVSEEEESASVWATVATPRWVVRRQRHCHYRRRKRRD
jgi:hypothetical protein